MHFFGTYDALTPSAGANIKTRQKNAMLDISIAQRTEEISLANIIVSLDLQKAVGEKYCFENRIIVLENTGNELTVALSDKHIPCIDELRKMMPARKKINIQITDADRIQSLFVKLYDLFGAYRYR
jgi:hypothetical protein